MSFCNRVIELRVSWLGIECKLMVIGELVTPAAWMRNFITSHPKYAKDSLVTDEINYDLTRAVDEM